MARHLKSSRRVAYPIVTGEGNHAERAWADRSDLPDHRGWVSAVPRVPIRRRLLVLTGLVLVAFATLLIVMTTRIE